MADHDPPTDANTPLPALWHYLANLKGDDREAWRLADIPDRPSADERELPKDYPFGWYVIDYSDELAVGELKPIRYFGQELALWRGDDGVARVIDAYCAHFGANMAHGGKVTGNYLECPFHAWRYDGEGAVKEIPYAKVIPPQARRKDCVPSWPTQEINGMIWIWYHPERVAPLWELEVFEEVGHPDWTPFKKFEWNVFSCMENVSENGIDISHFKYVHGAPTVPDYKISYDGIRRSVRADITLTTPRGFVDGAINVRSIGPGQAWARFSGLSETMLVSGNTPIDRDCVKIRFAFIQPKSEAGSRLAAGLIADICNQLDQDKVIFDRHKRIEPPLVCDGDGPFGRNRVFYNQFLVQPRPTKMRAA